jgi:hypothetical protein
MKTTLIADMTQQDIRRRKGSSNKNGINISNNGIEQDDVNDASFDIDNKNNTTIKSSTEYSNRMSTSSASSSSLDEKSKLSYREIIIICISIFVISIQSYILNNTSQTEQTKTQQYNFYKDKESIAKSHQQQKGEQGRKFDVVEVIQTNEQQRDTLNKQDDSNKNNKRQCRIYLAPSSVKGLDGYGIYTTEDINKNELILSNPDGPSIPIIDYIFEQIQTTEAQIGRQVWINLWDNYWWGRGVPDHVLRESNTMIDYQIMFGSLPNHHCSLSVLDYSWGQNNNNNNTSSSSLQLSYYDDTMDLPQNSPGSGAYSYYAGRTFSVKVIIKKNELATN